MLKVLLVAFFVGAIVININVDDSFAQGVLDSHNSQQPVEITADELEVKQNEQIAVFTGSVEAVQGNLNLRSDKMIVHYKSSKAKKGDKSAKGANGSSGNSISKIITDGNVFLSTPKESAKGDKGIFDVDKNIVTLTGKVLLTSGQNVVKGTKLVYDLTKGKSKIVGGSGNSGEGKKGRVRGVFVPGNK